MKRGEFFARVAGGAFAVSTAGALPSKGRPPHPRSRSRGPQPGKPHAGKVLAAIQPHSDDLPIFAGGTIAGAHRRRLHRLPDPDQ